MSGSTLLSQPVLPFNRYSAVSSSTMISLTMFMVLSENGRSPFTFRSYLRSLPPPISTLAPSMNPGMRFGTKKIKQAFVKGVAFNAPAACSPNDRATSYLLSYLPEFRINFPFLGSFPGKSSPLSAKEMCSSCLNPGRVQQFPTSHG